MYSQNPDAAPLPAYYKWYHSVNVPHIPCAHFRSDLSQQLFYVPNKLLLCLGFHMLSHIPFHCAPRVLYWVKIL